MPDHDDIKVAGGDAGTELFAVCLFKIRFAGNQNFGVGVQQQSLGCHLLGQVVGYTDQGLGAKPKTFLFHRCSDHFVGFPGAHHVRQQRIAAIQNVRNGVFLVGAQRDFGRHTVEQDMAAVVFAGAQGIEPFVVFLYQHLAAGRIFPDPVLESVLDLLLFHLGFLGGSGVQHPNLVALHILFGVEDAHIPQVQAFLQDMVEVGALRAVGHGGLNVAACKALVGHIPDAGQRYVQHLHAVPHIVGRVHQFIGKLLDEFRCQPSGTQTHGNFAGLQVFRLHGFQCLYIHGKSGVVLCRQLCYLQFVAHIAGKIFIGGIVARFTIRILFQGVGKDNTLQVVHQCVLVLADQLLHIPKVDARALTDTQRQRLAGGFHALGRAGGADGAL